MVFTRVKIRMIFLKTSFINISVSFNIWSNEHDRKAI